MFLDSHCHLTSEQLAPDFAGVVQRAAAQGVTAFLNIGDDLQSSEAALAQAQGVASLGVAMWATVGIHPQHAADFIADGQHATIAELRTLAANPLVRAIGEIGLDFVYDDSHAQYPGAPRDWQERVFIEQLQLANELKLPVVIHNRSADERLLTVIKEHQHLNLRGVFHCFGSPVEVAKQVLDLGFYLGFTGLVTFKNAEEVRDAARLCPLDRLLIETDCPYLAPVPFRGKTNEPAYLPRVADTIAALHGISSEEAGAITTQNAKTLFNLS